MWSEWIDSIQNFLAGYELKLLWPAGLWLLSTIPVFWLIGLRLHRQLPWPQRSLVQLLRTGLLVTMALALAQPVRLRQDASPAVIVLADLSASMSAPARAEMDKFMGRMAGMNPEGWLSLIGFGPRPAFLAGPQSSAFPRLYDQPAQDGTDIAAALRFCLTQFPPDYERRLVLLSDGQQTHGDARREAQKARALGIQIFPIPIEPPAAFDARLVTLTTTGQLRVGETATVTVEVWANERKKVRLHLRLEGAKIADRIVWAGPQKARVEFSMTPKKVGVLSLKAGIISRPDRYPQNNWQEKKILVAGRPRVLLVQSARQPTPLASLLDSSDLELTSTTDKELPRTIAEWTGYDLVILDDLPLAEWTATQVGMLRGYVEESGGGLLVAAGQQAQDLAGPEEAAIEPLLPVHFRQVKKKEKTPAALVFVLDRSASMAREKKFLILLRAVSDALARLRDNAQVAVVLFDDFPELVVPLTEARHRQEIGKAVLSQRVGGGTSMYPALSLARDQLAKSAARIKHVILLSDGQSISVFAHHGHIVEKMAKEGMTVTTVALGTDADKQELTRIAASSGGKFYFADSMANVPKIFTAETEGFTEKKAIEQEIHAEPAKLLAVLAGIDFKSAPALGGYLASEARPSSELMLRSSDRKEPLLARWRFGLGRVVLATTDIQGAWSATWTKWPGFANLWTNLVKDTLRNSPPGDLRLSGMMDGDQALLSLWLRPGLRSPSPPKLWVMAPNGQETALPVHRRGLGHFRAQFRLDREGAYAFRAQRLARSGVVEQAFLSLHRPAAQETWAATADLEMLADLATITGAKLNPSPEEIFAPGRVEREQHESRWPPLLFLAMIMFLSEALVRKV